MKQTHEELFTEAFLPEKEKKKIYSVGELTRHIQGLLESHFPEVWVEGEISNLSTSARGHLYFSLKDEQALLKCAFFASNHRRVKFQLDNGLKVICRGAIGLYAPRGEYQLIVEVIEPKGIGALQLAFEQLKKKLAKEGLFDERRKKPLPFLPDAIGVVTSLSGKAVRDILKVIRSRFPEMPVVIRDVRVQGAGAAGEIAQAIEDFNRWGGVDLLLVGRGGGSIEDLWAFNEEVVARSIFRSRIPIISCVGHELDYTIADFVADVRAGTPSMAAELAIPKKRDLVEEITTLRQALSGALREKWNLYAEQLSQCLESPAFRKPERLFGLQEQHLDQLTLSLKGSLSRQTEQFVKRSEVLKAKLFLLRPTQQLLKFQTALQNCFSLLTHRIGSRLQTIESRFAFQVGKLGSLSPLKILERGYSVTSSHPDGSILRSVERVKRGDRIRTRLFRGSLVSRVEALSNEDNQNG